MQLTIATGQSRFDKLWKNTKLSWDELVERLSKTTRTSETAGQFVNMTKSRQDNIKDVGGFVGGAVVNGQRRSGMIESRTLLTLDADFASDDFCDMISMLYGFTYCIYSTHKHTPDKPRLRLVIPLSRPVTPDEYEAVARKIAEDIGIDMFDDTTYQAHRLMYWPSTPLDGEYVFEHEENEPLDPDEVLSRYRDWRDVSSWPVSSRTVKALDRRLKKQEDPTTKTGIIGAFCRAYDIHSAIEKFIPEAYEQCAGGDRYTYTEGSSAAGLVVYENGKFAYSNHATDPASCTLCNAFDLVRIHKFGELDADMKPGTPIAKAPSFVKMSELAAADKVVKTLLFKEKQAKAVEDFGELPDDSVSEDDGEWSLELTTDKRNNYEKTLDNVRILLEHEPRLKGRIYADDFAGAIRVNGILPWDKKAEAHRTWKDSDTDGLQWFLEKYYGISMGNTKVFSALSVYCRKVAQNPVKEYLNGLEWDGIPRLDTLFIDYLGAADNVYTREATRKMFVAAVARIFEPGTKFDTMLVLSGRQGIGKSTLLRKMGRDKWFTDAIRTFEGKELCEIIQGRWIVEVSELEALNKSEVGRVRQILSQTTDVFRAAYGRVVQDNPRRCVFFGTSNNDDYLRDTTGNRRFWPIDVSVTEAKRSVFRDLDNEIDQLWAEAVHGYKNKEILVLMGEAEKLAKEAQEGHRERSDKEGLIADFLERKVPSDWNKRSVADRRLYWVNEIEEDAEELVERDRVCAIEIWCELFGGDSKYFRRSDANEINGILRMLPGWTKTKTVMRYGKYGVQKGFVKCNL